MRDKIREATEEAFDEWLRYGQKPPARHEIIADAIPGWIIAGGVDHDGNPVIEYVRWSELIRWYKRACKCAAKQLARGEEVNMGEAMNETCDDSRQRPAPPDEGDTDAGTD